MERKNAAPVSAYLHLPHRAVLDVRRGALSEQNNRTQGGSRQRSIYTGFDTPYDIVKERTLAVCSLRRYLFDVQKLLWDMPVCVEMRIQYPVLQPPDVSFSNVEDSDDC